MKNIIKLIEKAIPAIALKAGVNSLNSVCATTYYQPKIDASLNEYRK